MSYDAGTVVIGAGVVGLAIARELSLRGTDVLLLEEKHTFGTQTSSRHSEVIHAGIYYQPQSYKAILCTRGKSLLYKFCDSHAIEHKRIGKIIVATSAEQITQLQSIASGARANGVSDLHILSSNQVNELEPAIDSYGGVLSPSTGIIDSHGYMLALLGDAQTHGASIAYNAGVENITPTLNGFTVEVAGEQIVSLTCKHVINAAGHGAVALAAATNGLHEKHIPEMRYAKGNYFRLQGASPVSRLIYPVPVPGGLGIHITMDLAGQARFGPDVEWIDELNYDVDPNRSAKFYEAIRRYWPALKDNSLEADYAGVRPKVAFNNIVSDDFIIQTSDTHGVNGLINLFGMESPGVTASLAIAEYTATRLLSA